MRKICSVVGLVTLGCLAILSQGCYTETICKDLVIPARQMPSSQSTHLIAHPAIPEVILSGQTTSTIRFGTIPERTIQVCKEVRRLGYDPKVPGWDSADPQTVTPTATPSTTEPPPATAPGSSEADDTSLRARH